MKRVMIMGQPGSGKSTLARQIGARTGLPVVHVDRIHWMPGWQERPKAEKIALALAEEARDAWVFEGGLSATWSNRTDRADTLIFLDFPLWLRVWRVFRRTVRWYGRTRPDMQDACPERFSAEFWRWIWNTRATGRIKPLAALASARADQAVWHLTGPRAVRAFLASLPPG